LENLSLLSTVEEVLVRGDALRTTQTLEEGVFVLLFKSLSVQEREEE
jgi:hypothetical protein